uniref:(northern house mosquito) hypothetical protein n=1 Tax=Culex pipiens TaxID=7175 RepID=A0A8D8B401_CULPI
MELAQTRKPFPKGGKFSLFRKLRVRVCYVTTFLGTTLFRTLLKMHLLPCGFLLQPTKNNIPFSRWWGPSKRQAQISSTVGGMMKLAASVSCCCLPPHTETEKNRSKTEKPVSR